MSLNRRRFLQQGGGLAAALIAGQTAGTDLLPGAALCRAPRLRKTKFVAPAGPQRQQLSALTLARFVDALPLPEIARPEGKRADPADAHRQLPYYRMSMREIEQTVHRDVKPTRFWSYGNTVPGPVLETRSGEGVWVDWGNALPTRHFLPIDHNLHGAEAGKPEVRTVVHVHGAKAPPASDGYPDAWYTPGHSRLYCYPNQQDAALLWYHDHTMGIERLNVYAGLFGSFIVRDAAEEALGLPKGEYEIPLTLFDRGFDREGQLYYPDTGDPEAPWVSEAIGDAILANGKIYPYLDVQPRAYRFRLLNASNGRSFDLSLANGQGFQQIGSDQGLLQEPAPLSNLFLAPAERADLVVDFSQYAGQNVVLKDHRLNDVMQFRVAAGKAMPLALPARLRTIERIPEASAVRTRTMTLREYADPVSGETTLLLLNGKHWHDPVTEKPELNTVEIWELVNLTEDTHPIHLHLVRFQVLDRRSFSVQEYRSSGKMVYLGQPIPPKAGETGWKDTVQAFQRSVTRIIVRFEGFTGRYLWHCHIMEHAGNDMMRPLEVLPPRKA
ncbi:multicopper oxidase family protein [Nevskia soli]|uniref:multicopper oxidase family protein n=1 Tax=Nevskia soli TaxID=418856 RepID=UPI0004A70DEE|nr:multicopper oxidase [Nevskia soli]